MLKARQYTVYLSTGHVLDLVADTVYTTREGGRQFTLGGTLVAKFLEGSVLGYVINETLH